MSPINSDVKIAKKFFGYFGICMASTIILTLLTIVYLHSVFSHWNSVKHISYNKIVKQCKSYQQVESVNWNYFYYYEDKSTKQSLIWCKVPKAGSTSLTNLFLRLAGVKDLQNATKIHKLLRLHYPKLPTKVMKDRTKLSTTFMITRDPFERILSAFRDKLESYERDLLFRDGYYHENYGKYMVGNIKNSNNKNSSESVAKKEPTWKQFVQYLLRTSVARFDEHWMPITRLCSPCNFHFDAIIKLEDFDKDIPLILEKGGIHMSRKVHAHRTGTAANQKLISSYFKNLTIGEVKRLYVKYKRDFQLFGYTPFKYYKMASGHSKILKKGKSMKNKQ